MLARSANKSLIRTDVAGRLVAAYVLLSRLHRQHPALLPAVVERLPSDATWHASQELLTTRHDAKIGSAVGHRVPERLPFGDDDVHPVVARSTKYAETDRIDRRDKCSFVFVSDCCEFCKVFRAAKEVGLLNDDARRFVVHNFRNFSHVNDTVWRRDVHKLGVNILEIRFQDLTVLGVNRFEHHNLGTSSSHAERHQCRFGDCASAVVETCIRHVHSRQLANQRLVFEHRLQIALAYFRLVWRVGSVKLAARGERVDNGRNEVVVAAAAEEANRILRVQILVRERAHVLSESEFAHRRGNLERSFQSDRFGNSCE